MSLSGLKRLNPFALLACIIPQTVLAMFIKDPVVTLISLAFGLVLYVRVNGAGVLKKVPLFLLLALLAGFFNTFINHRGDTPFLFINDSPLTFEAFFYGFRFAAVIFAAMLWFAVLTRLFGSESVLYVFSRISPGVALVVSAVLRYIPLFSSRIREVSEAHTAMGTRDDRKLADRVRLAGDTVAAMVTWSCENAIDSADSMRARGYGSAKRSDRRIRRFSAFDLAVTVSGLLLISAILILIALGAGDFTYYPSISFPNGTLTYLLYLTSFLLSILPLCVEIREEILWKHSR